MSTSSIPSPKSGSLSKTREAAEYIADIVMELRNLAKAEKLFALRDYLEIAYYEAFMQANKIEMPPGELERLEELEEDFKRSEM